MLVGDAHHARPEAAAHACPELDRGAVVRDVHRVAARDSARRGVTEEEVIEHIGTAGRNEVLTYRAEVGTVEGEPVATLRSTIIIRGTAPRPEGDAL